MISHISMFLSLSLCAVLVINLVCMCGCINFVYRTDNGRPDYGNALCVCAIM